MDLARKCGNLIIKCVLREIKSEKRLASQGNVDYTLIDDKSKDELQFVVKGWFAPKGYHVFTKYEIIGAINVYEVRIINVIKCA